MCRCSKRQVEADYTKPASREPAGLSDSGTAALLGYALRPIVCRSLFSKSLDVCVRVLEQNAEEPFAYAENSVEIRTYVVVMMKAALILVDIDTSDLQPSRLTNLVDRLVNVVRPTL